MDYHIYCLLLVSSHWKVRPTKAGFFFNLICSLKYPKYLEIVEYHSTFEGLNRSFKKVITHNMGIEQIIQDIFPELKGKNSETDGAHAMHENSKPCHYEHQGREGSHTKRHKDV